MLLQGLVLLHLQCLLLLGPKQLIESPRLGPQLLPHPVQ
jgi:hypothetical protein